jgi:hypothetical protein
MEQIAYRGTYTWRGQYGTTIEDHDINRNYIFTPISAPEGWDWNIDRATWESKLLNGDF